MRCIGHAGASGLAPANSLRSLDLAVELGADVVEFDVRRCGGRLLAAHDVLHARRPGVLALEDVLRWAAGQSVAVNVDLKTAGTEEEAVEGLRRHGLLERALLCSQVVPILRRVRAVDPAARTGLSVAGCFSRALHRWGDWRHTVLAELREGGHSALMAHRRLVDAALVDRVHAAGAEVHAWTVRRPDEAQRLTALGVDGIVTTDPRIVLGPALLPAAAVVPGLA